MTQPTRMFTIVCHRTAYHFHLLTFGTRDEINTVLARQATCHICGAPLVLDEFEASHSEALQAARR